MRKKCQNIVDLYTQAVDFHLFFNEGKAQEKEKEIKGRNRLAVRIGRGRTITIFEIKKVI